MDNWEHISVKKRQKTLILFLKNIAFENVQHVKHSVQASMT